MSTDTQDDLPGIAITWLAATQLRDRLVRAGAVDDKLRARIFCWPREKVLAVRNYADAWERWWMDHSQPKPELPPCLRGPERLRASNPQDEGADQPCP